MFCIIEKNNLFVKNKKECKISKDKIYELTKEYTKLLFYENLLFPKKLY